MSKPSTTEPIASLRGVAYSHDGRRPALDGLDLDVPAGVVTALVGPNGSGKSTALGVLAGLHAPRSGTVRVPPRGDVALVVQRSEAQDRLPVTVHDVVAMGRWAGLGWWRRTGAVDRAAVRRRIDQLGLAAVADERLGELSGGQRQRALVAQALVREAGLLLLDEPTTGLDAHAREVIGDALRAEADRGVAVVLATHDLDAARSCDHVVLLAAGRAVASGPAAHVLTDARLAATLVHARSSGVDAGDRRG